MQAFRDSMIIRVSVGILATIGAGLVAGTLYLAKLSIASDMHSDAIKELQVRQTAIEQFSSDIAVIKNRLDSIDKKLDN